MLQVSSTNHHKTLQSNNLILTEMKLCMKFNALTTITQRNFFGTWKKDGGRRERQRKINSHLLLVYSYLKPRGKNRCACRGTIIEKKYL